jgi:hypothetical protein
VDECKPLHTGDAVDIKTIVQGGFMNEWIAKNEKRAGQITTKQEWREPKMTKAGAYTRPLISST